MIDVHILAHPDFPVQPMVESMAHSKINMHVLPHVEGNLLAARHAGFSAGIAPFVSWVDPDDAVLNLEWIDEALEILEDPKISAVYPRWKSTKNGRLNFQVPEHVWHPKYSHMRNLPYAHHLTIMRRECVEPFFAEAFKRTSTAKCFVDPLLAQSMQRYGRLHCHPAVAYEWKLREGSTRTIKNERESAAWADSLYLQLLSLSR